MAFARLCTTPFCVEAAAVYYTIRCIGTTTVAKDKHFEDKVTKSKKVEGEREGEVDRERERDDTSILEHFSIGWKGRERELVSERESVSKRERERSK